MEQPLTEEGLNLVNQRDIHRCRRSRIWCKFNKSHDRPNGDL